MGKVVDLFGEGPRIIWGRLTFVVGTFPAEMAPQDHLLLIRWGRSPSSNSTFPIRSRDLPRKDFNQSPPQGVFATERTPFRFQLHSGPSHRHRRHRCAITCRRRAPPSARGWTRLSAAKSIRVAPTGHKCLPFSRKIFIFVIRTYRRFLDE